MPTDFDRRSLAVRGFSGFSPLSSVLTDPHQIPDASGVYAVLLPSAAPAFLSRSVGGRFKTVDGTIGVERLRAEWVPGTDTLYVGRGNRLRRRLVLLARYGQGEPVAHRGGGLLWQLAKHDQLLVAWRAQVDPVAPEADLLCEFEATYGWLPFANLMGGSRPLTTVA